MRLDNLFKKVCIVYAFLFLIPFLIFFGIQIKILKNEILYPIFYQISITFALFMAIFYFLKIEKKWKDWMGWLFVVLSLVFLFIGDTIWNYYAILFLEEAPFPGISDLFYIFFYIFAFIFLLYFIFLLRLSLTSTEKILVSIVSLVFIILLFQEVALPIAFSKDMKLLEKFLNLFYIFGDLGLIILSFILLIQLWGGKVARNYSFFILGISLTTIADILFAYIFKEYGIANWVDSFYLASFLLLSLSVISESLLHYKEKCSK